MNNQFFNFEAKDKLLKQVAEEYKNQSTEKLKDVELKRCPFCGGEAEEQSTVICDMYMHEIVCKDCGVETKVQIKATPEEARQKAIETWNTRIINKSTLEEKNGVNDCLTLGIDFMPDLENGCLVVMRQRGDDIYVVNQFRNDEALELYNKLIGVKENELL